MNDKHLVVGILARDCKEKLEKNIPRVEELCSHYTKFNIIAYENDSKDGTDILLQQWAKRNENVFVINETFNETTIPKDNSIQKPGKSVYRISRMVKFRNRVLDEVRKRCTPDFFCFIDIDLENFNPSSIVNAINNAPDDWGGLFASGHIVLNNTDGSTKNAPFQYDTYACMYEDVNYTQTGSWVISNRFHRMTGWTMDEWVRNTDYYPCNSAFNGIGIYKWDIIKNLRYEVEYTEELKEGGHCFCEHVPFNYRVKEMGYRLYIVKDMETVYKYMKNSIYSRYKYKMTTLKVKFLLHFNPSYPVKCYK